MSVQAYEVLLLHASALYFLVRCACCRLSPKSISSSYGVTSVVIEFKVLLNGLEFGHVAIGAITVRLFQPSRTFKLFSSRRHLQISVSTAQFAVYPKTCKTLPELVLYISFPKSQTREFVSRRFSLFFWRTSLVPSL